MLAGGLDDLAIGLICGIVAVAVFVCVCNCWYYGCCEACCEIFESDDPPIPKSTQEVGQALVSGRMVEKSGKESKLTGDLEN